MRFLRWIGIALAVLMLGLVAIAIIARSSDGPLAVFQGGPLRMGELAAVTSVDGRTIGNAMTGPMTERLSELYAKRTAAEGYSVVGE
jgi:hypothetical protein